ncbi:hypothetical protein M0C34_13860 [Agarivorans sp. TSD2052]|uniref:hypothetical protein n=1 Tax=Agarivorans sp. TSD2052 TaxID=2937286 RepID=UPI002010468D|nr:hypothetical protein [Agarivorans sp. TSD2052]UPW17325.1 hypothetical protein M0C34_13860 [Agarivorans sp. TSD2052]
MRVFRTISKKKHDELVGIFPVLDTDEYGKLEEWDFVAVTVFDHWLHRDDAIRYIDNRTLDEQKYFDCKWAKFNELLASELNPYLVKYRSAGRVVFKEPKSIELLTKRLDLTKNQSFITLAFPEQRAVYEQHYDDTHLLYFECHDNLKPLLELIEKSGLYTLSRI